ncbi:MAG: ATP-binding protein [Treponema sp.]|nr:ATP-binding protein [Treponema sp.]MCL2250505.1 ATP-binding protein [Treponema sp.]
MLWNFKIRDRLLISFFIVVFLTLIVGITGFISITSLGDSAVKTMHNVSIFNDIYDFNAAINASISNILFIKDINLAHYVIQTTIVYMEEFLDHINQFFELQDQFIEIFSPGEMQDIINLFEIFNDIYVPIVNEIFHLVEMDLKEEALSVYINRFTPLFDTFTYFINEGFMINLENSIIETNHSYENASIRAYLMLAIVLLSLIVSIALAFYVTRSISVPLSNLAFVARRIANGELDIKFEILQSKDEIGSLSRRLNESLQFMIQAQQLKLDAIKAQHEKEKAEAASKTKDDFLAKMSHEIRTPMNAIIGMAELLSRSNLSKEAYEYVQDIKHAGNNLISIINDILDISKIEAGKMEIVPASYLLSSLIYDTVNIIRIRLAEKPIKFNTHIGEGIPNALKGDVVRLRQVLLNLLSNAVKYTDEGSIDMFLSIEKRSLIQVWLKVDVSDTGKGIKKEDQQKLFNDFVRFDSKENKGIEGTGLGLSIARRLCHAMGGDITVVSEYGKGSTFTMIIPQVIESEEPLSANFEVEKDYQDQSGTVRFIIPHARILVVDDIPTNLKVAEGLLALYKINVDTCLSGFEAIELVKQKDYDLVFMDHMMPDMDGIETVARIRHDEQLRGEEPVPIIALTANAVVGMREMFIENGFNDFLAKPIDTLKLDEILDHWIQKEKKKAEISINKEKEQEKNISLLDISGVDTKIGIARTGGRIESYLSVLAAFINDYEEKLTFFTTMPNAESLKMFTIQVHALKSAAAYIGASDVSAQALALEKAGKESDFEFIEKNLNRFSSDLAVLITNIQNAKNIYNESLSQKTDTDHLKPLLNKLKEALEANEASSDIFTIIDEINKLSLDAKVKDKMEKISYQVLLSEYEEAVKITDELK